jgi:hypothetical protein
MIESSIDKGEDIDDTKESLQELKATEKATFEEQKKAHAEALKEAQKVRKESLQKLENYISNTKEIIPGQPISKTVKDKVYKNLVTPVKTVKYKDDSGKEVEKGLDKVDAFFYDEGAIGRYKLAYLLEITENLTKLDMLSTKKAVSKAQAALEDSLRTSDIKKFQSFSTDDFKGLDNFVDIDNS